MAVLAINNLIKLGYTEREQKIDRVSNKTFIYIVFY